MIPHFRSQCRAVLLVLLSLAGQTLAVRTLAAQDRGAPAPPPDTTEANGVSARGALLRSFAIPGWGQTYAKAPGRGAVYFAMEAGSLWMLYKSRQQLSAARARDSWLHETTALPVGQISSLTRARARQFEDWTTLAITLALFSGADAYVTAQLSDFSEHVQVGPAAGGALEIRGGIPIGRTR
jgi:hypothetical protein